MNSFETDWEIKPLPLRNEVVEMSDAPRRSAHWKREWVLQALALSGQKTKFNGRNVEVTQAVLQELIPDKRQYDAFLRGDEEEFFK